MNCQPYKANDMSKIAQEDLDILKAFVKGDYQFVNSYSYLAADINEDKKIDVEDVVILEEINKRGRR